MSTSHWLTNIKLETGYLQDDKGAYTTTTELFHLKIEDGKIIERHSSNYKISDNEKRWTEEDFWHCHLLKKCTTILIRPIYLLIGRHAGRSKT